MSDTSSRTSRDYDPWVLATPQHLLTLLERLGVSGSEVARWLRVPRSSISMWRTGTRVIPSKHIRALRTWTRLAFDQAAELNSKAMALAPTEDVRQALRAEFAGLWLDWKTRVLHEAGLVRRNLQANYQALGQWLAHEPFTAEDEDSIASVMDTMRQQVRLLRTLEGDAPDPEQEALERLTQAHEAAHPTPSDEDASTP